MSPRRSLKLNFLNSRLPIDHPDRLPTFEPILLGMSVLLVGLGLLEKWPAIGLLAPVTITFCTLLSLPIVQFIPLVGLLALLAGLLHSDGVNLQQIWELCALSLLGTQLRRFLTNIEWRLASQSVLANLLEADVTGQDRNNVETIRSLISQALTLLQQFAGADAAIALRQLDDVTAEVLVSLPAKAFPGSLTTPAFFAAALEKNRCLYYSNYPNHPDASHLLLAQGTKSLAILPLQDFGNFRGAILLIWYQHTEISLPLQNFIESLLGKLRTLLQFSDTTLNLDKLQARFSAMLETIHQGVVFLDEGGEQAWLNQAAALQLRLTPGVVEPSAIASSMASLRMGAENQAEIAAQGAQFFSKPQAIIRDWNWIFQQPEKRVLSISSTPTKVRNISGRLWILDDITDRYFAQLALEEKTQELSEANIELEKAKAAAEAATLAKSQFLANMSHELRSPLNAILGFSQLMVRSKNLPKENLENLGIITRSGEHLLTLINNILDLSKIEAGRITLNEKNFDFYRLLDDLEDMFQLKAADKQLHLIFDRAFDLPQYIRSDEVKLRQVLINLLNNALKFTQEGGVSVKVSTIDDRQNVKNQAITIRFEVEDTGTGISPDELDKIFEAFVQSKTGKEAQEGTGLGLPISREFVHLMGGEMQVSSVLGHGSIFKFEIKASVVESAEIEVKKPICHIIALEPDQPRYRILIVDDKWDNRQLLIKLLNPLGFEIQEACDGQEAIEIWDKFSPHLIWMDMRMPVMDGYTATKQIKATTKGQATAIVALTASVFEEERAVVLSAGCDDFVRKPFREMEIFETMHKHLGVRYVYEQEASPQSGKVDASLILNSTYFKKLPAKLINNLEQALLSIDMELIDNAIAEIAEIDRALAEAIKIKTDNFEYDLILGLIQKLGNGKEKEL